MHSSPRPIFRQPGARALIWTLPLCLAAGCASTQTDAQWRDPQLAAGRSLHSEKVLVACDAYEAVIKQLCQDQLVSEVEARGATPVLGPDPQAVTPWRPAKADQYLAAARQKGATAILTASITPGLATVKPGFSIGLGLGSFGGSVGGGVGVSAPIGGSKVESGYTSDSQLTDVGTGRLIWTAKVSTPPSSNVNQQMVDLAKGVAQAIEKAGFL